MPVNRTEDSPFGIQADGSSYFSSKYLDPYRMSSISMQLTLCEQSGCSSFLDIGSGNGLLVWLLRRTGKAAFSLDHNAATVPDVVGLLPQLPMVAGAVEGVTCFQVLEHLPLNLFVPALLELRRVASQHVIISLPDATPPDLARTWKTPVKHAVYAALGAPIVWKPQTRRPINPEHFWELGHGGVTTEFVVERVQTAGLRVIQRMRNPLNHYHHFFLCERA